MIIQSGRRIKNTEYLRCEKNGSIVSSYYDIISTFHMKNISKSLKSSYIYDFTYDFTCI